MRTVCESCERLQEERGKEGASLNVQRDLERQLDNKLAELAELKREMRGILDDPVMEDIGNKGKRKNQLGRKQRNQRTKNYRRFDKKRKELREELSSSDESSSDEE